MATIRPGDMNMSTTPTLSTTSLPAPTPIFKAEKRPVAPRINIEPLYVAVKSAISDTDWSTYKSSISAFLLGTLNQEELTSRLDRILSTPALEHAHNQFITAIFANSLRDAPEAGTASWADDKVVTRAAGPGAGKGGSGSGEGEIEKRLKSEVMQLARRERKRLKGVDGGIGVGPGAKDNATGGIGGMSGGVYGGDMFTQLMQEALDAKRIKTPDTGPASAGGFQKTNWEIEIRKRYTTPLFTETHEFPDPTSISTRMLPICYENGLPSGHTPDCPTFMNLATETYIKEALTNFFSRVSSNGPGYIRTAEYRRKVDKEEEKVGRGELGRSVGGLLPVEVEEMRKRRPLCMEDLRLALGLGDAYFGQTPMLAAEIENHGVFLDTYGIEESLQDVHMMDRDGVKIGVSGVNGVGGNNGYGYHVDLGDPVVNEEDWQWVGGGVQDVDGLDTVLDACLTVGT